MNGALCSILSFLALAYFVSVSVVQYTLLQTYTHNFAKTTYSLTNPEIFEVQSNLLTILSNLNSTHSDIAMELDQYVGGVYMEMTFSNKTGKKSYQFVEAVDCITIYPNLTPNEQLLQQDYKCPKNESFMLKGNLGQVGQDFVKEFYYVVSSCQSMQTIYQEKFKKTWSATCKDYDTEIKPNLQYIDS